MKHIRSLTLTTLFCWTNLERRSLAFFAVVTTMLVSALLLAPARSYAKKGKPEPPAPVLPDVRYSLTWLDWGDGWETRARDMNDAGEVVGFAYDPGDQQNRRGFLYTAATGMVDLNGIPSVWIDLDAEPGADPPTGWIACEAEGINELGEIVGTAEHDVTLERRAFLLVHPIDLTPQFLLLPRVGEGDNFGAAVNDLGEVVAYSGVSGTPTILYTPIAAEPWYTGEVLGFDSGTIADINDAGVIVTRAGFRSTPGQPVEYFPGHLFYGINDGNPTMITGSRERTRGKNGQEGGVIRLSEVSGDPVEILGNGLGFDINNTGDVCFADGNRGFVYTDLINPDTGQKFGAVALDDLVLNQDADWVDRQYITPWAINNPDGTGFGQICGIGSFGAFGPHRAFLLTPEPFQEQP